MVDTASPNAAPAEGDATAATILIVDDQPENLYVLAGLLEPYYRVKAARSGERALHIAAENPRPDLILLDIMMPGMDGYAVLEKLAADPETKAIPVIFVTALDDEQDEKRGLELGAVDYLSKPVKPLVLLARVRTHLELKAAKDALAGQNAKLEQTVAERTEALRKALLESKSAHARLNKTHFSTLLAFNQLSALRDVRIGDHARRVADLSRKVAINMGLSDEEVQNVFVGALLHDVGKIGFSDELLNKIPSTLQGADLVAYRRHPARGADALANLDAMAAVAEIIRCHHENYDGRGFPEGRTALNIPIGARIVAAVSDYDGLKNNTLVVQPMTAKQAFQYLLEEQGRRYDPKVVLELEKILATEENIEIDEILVATRHLQEGMVLSQDILHPKGFILLSKGAKLTRFLIDELAGVEANTPKPLRIYVNRHWSAASDNPGSGKG